MYSVVFILVPMLAGVLAGSGAAYAFGRRMPWFARATIVMCLPVVLYAIMTAIVWWALTRGFDGTCDRAFMDLDSLPGRRPCSWDRFASTELVSAYVLSAPALFLNMVVVPLAYVGAQRARARRGSAARVRI